MRVVTHALYITADSLSELTAKSSVIVIGTVPNSEPDAARVQDPSSGNSTSSIANVYAVGSGYNVQVERYLKGSGGNTIPVIQFYGLDYTDRGQAKQARDENEKLLMGKGNRYLLFLRENGTYRGYWIGTAHPYKFLLAGGRAISESPVPDPDGAFPERSESKFINLVESLIAGSSGESLISGNP